MKPSQTGALWIISICATVFSTCAIADIPSAANECVSDLVETTPSSDFTSLEAGAVVRHELTGLEWRRCPEGMSWTGNGCGGDAVALSWEGALQHADAVSGWRLPNINELRSIVEHCVTLPAINRQVFPDTPISQFWSGSPFAFLPGMAWIVDFSWGRASNLSRGVAGPVRLVRGGQ